MQLTESEVQSVLDELDAMRLLFTEQGSRVTKYKHRFCNTEFSSLKFTVQEYAIICVLFLRGPQTPGELRTRCNRLADFSNVQEVESVLNTMSDFNGETLIVKLDREPGKREARYAHTFSDIDLSKEAAPLKKPNDSDLTLEEAFIRIEALENQVAQLRQQLNG